MQDNIFLNDIKHTAPLMQNSNLIEIWCEFLEMNYEESKMRYEFFVEAAE
jgi:hypothetical protein